MSDENYGIWLENTDRADFPRGVLPDETEVLIVGGGITGVTAAYLLAKEGRRVVLLEKKKLGERATVRTTGFITQVIDASPAKLIKLFGLEKARLIFASHSDAIDGIEAIIRSENIECEFERCSSYIYANDHGEEKDLLKMTEDFKQLSVKAEYKKDNALKFAPLGYIEIPNQAKFHSIKYVTALAKLAKNHGAVIAEDTEVLSLDDKNGLVTVNVKDAGSIKAKKVLSATYAPFGEPPRLIHKCNMYRTYALEYKLPAGALTEATYQDNLIPYHYFRVDSQNGYDRLIIGGADHLEVLDLDHEINSKIVRKYTEKLFADHKPEEIRHWSGMILNSVNSLAYIGEYDGGNIFYAFAFSGTGMTYSYIAGKILADKLASRENPYSKIYATDRKISWRANIFG
jgi:glycine/D-amino acid oxidase-like deaminating enzyme